MPIQQIIDMRILDQNAKSFAKAWTLDIEEEALQQIRSTCTLPFIFKHLAVMPDAHWGNGSTVGTVLATRKALIPAAVGVDIGCGMKAVRLNLFAHELPDSLLGIRTALEKAIPHGRTDNGGVNDRGSWGEAPATVQQAGFALSCDERFVQLVERHPGLIGKHTRATAQLGTLGSGNHFVELCLDKSNGVWLMLHSGSRGIGNKIGTYFIDRAMELMEQWHITLADKHLAYLPEETLMFEDYWNALSWAQDYALDNRSLMMNNAIAALAEVLERDIAPTEHIIDSHHNYATIENHFGENVYVTRKGAVRARLGDWGIIPGSMGAKSFIVRGKGNPDAFHSCAHGAGRAMSRGEAKRRYTLDDFQRETDGVECRKDVGVLDEIPSAYKSIDKVMSEQSDLVEIIYELKQIVCVKG